MGTFTYRLFVLLSLLISVVIISFAFDLNQLVFRETRHEVGPGNTVFEVSLGTISVGLLALLHFLLAIFFKWARYIYLLLLILWIPAAFAGRIPGMPHPIDTTYMGIMIVMGLVAGVVFALSFSGRVGGRFGDGN